MNESDFNSNNEQAAQRFLQMDQQYRDRGPRDTTLMGLGSLTVGLSLLGRAKIGDMVDSSPTVAVLLYPVDKFAFAAGVLATLSGTALWAHRKAQEYGLWPVR